ncbi:MAG: YcxB family protein [Armatimonadetes bacterium]|nr:YcxB family protein [Armatimonadota bacterium]
MSIDYTDKTLVAQIEKYEFSESEHVTYAWHLQRRRSLIIVLVVEVITFFVLKYSFQANALTIVVALIAYALLLAAIYYVTIRLYVRKARSQPAEMTGSVTIFEDGIRSNVNDSEGWMPWTSFIGYRMLPFGIALQMNPVLGFILSKRVFKSDEDWSKTFKLVERKLKLIK